MDAIASELNMPGNQILAKFYDMLKKTSKYLLAVIEGHIESNMKSETQLNRGEDFIPVSLSLNDELEETAQQLSKKQKEELRKLKMESLKEFAIKGTDEDWSKALTNNDGKTKLISVKRYTVYKLIESTCIIITHFFVYYSGIKRLEDPIEKSEPKEQPKKKKIKFSKKTKASMKSLI